MTNGHVFAGVVRWPGGANMVAPPETLGGVFRLGVGESEWEHMTRGLPAECHVPCITVDPHDANRVYAGTQEFARLEEEEQDAWAQLRGLSGLSTISDVQDAFMVAALQ